MEKLFYAAVGAVVGFFLNEFRTLLSRRRKHRSYWSALQIEVDYAKGRAQMYIDDNIMAPLYRLPTKAFENCYPELLADGAMTDADATALMAFYAEVDTFNRGLDRVGEAPDHVAQHAEYSRNLLKVKQLVARGALYEAANACLKRHL